MVTDLALLGVVGKSGYEAGLFAVDLEHATADTDDEPEWMTNDVQLLNKRGLLCFSADDYLKALSV